MLKSLFNYDLPDSLIAQEPPVKRGESRLLYMNGKGQCEDKVFRDLLDLLQPGDLLVLNDTRVIPARLYGAKESGGKIEILIERVLSPHEVLAHIKSSKSPKPNTNLKIDGGYEARVVGRLDNLFHLVFPNKTPVHFVLQDVGHIPLPPYITRPDAIEDYERYQTVFAKTEGAVAAPTAGLHFDDKMLTKINDKGIDITHVTLHVGSGTFQPVRVENLDDHKMHAEYCEVSEQTVRLIKATKANGGRVIAIGTTVVRSLETASLSGQISSFTGDTAIFIRPGFTFNCVDALLTNFHLPESTLLALVCAFSGYDEIMNAYRHAISSGYRFFSYGDAMFVLRQPK